MAHKLPIIDIAPYLDPHETKGRLSTSAALHDACLNYGFFYLDIRAYASKAETDELTRLAREFFELPQEEKDRIALKNEDGARGYARLHENVTNGKADNHEGIDFYRPVENPDKTRPLWGENQWPAVPTFRAKYEEWINKMKALGLIVMEAMAVGLGMTPEEWSELRAQVDDSFWVLRVIGYPQLPDDHDGFSCGAHKDYGCLTFLYADPTPNALEVFLRPAPLGEISANVQASTEEAGRYISADPIEGCIVVNIGEMWETWTNGLYKSTLHRVVHRGTNYRYVPPCSTVASSRLHLCIVASVSIPFFFEPNFSAEVKPLAAALRLQNYDANTTEGNEDKAQLLYPLVIYGDFLLQKVGGNFASAKGKYA
ncbi:hypothetical protein PLICRDRAFT_113458 [Plicaturopsis crispa FD-325 SS-3]|nr:hypothetical protein PLICRDRAFT_113458 [Plicaturopsis crispa FD-325 SS-3]